ncbi:MAG: AAA family ATPase [Candidatus Altiarchaeota archaeon]|nr:AAA family ATPase [Candidatus Altiarchaeota archaeon]
MKTTKITTTTFPVAEKAEKKIEKKLKKKEAKIRKAYQPLAKYRTEREEKHGKEYKKKTNYIYVDLNEGEIHFLKNKEIRKYDILKRVYDLQPAKVKTLAELLWKGSRLREEIEEETIEELQEKRLIDVYRLKGRVLAALLIDELSADPTGKKTETKEHVKADYELPDYMDKGYDLSQKLEEEESIVESYERDTIRYPVDRIAGILKNLYDVKTTLEGITYMPYLKAEHKSKVTEKHYPLCFNKKAKKKKTMKLKPIALSTEIGAKNAVPMESSTIDFKDVVGLKEVKKEIEDTFLKPLKDPELAKKLKKKAGGSLLLYGPPGCGKTYMAKAVVGETGLPFYNVNVNDVIGLGAEEAAEKIHRIFEEANQNAPAIIFFDELDAVGRKRDTRQRQEERIMLTQLLTEMDGVNNMTENVLIIAATNIPWELDPALRRAGRFNKQVFVPPPEKEVREQLFKKYVKELPIGEIDHGKLAEESQGYAASDIKTICEKAAQTLWHEKERVETEDLLNTLREHKNSLTAWFRLAEKEIRESNEVDLYRELSKHILKHAGGVDQVQKTEIKFKDVAGMESVKKEIKKNIVYPIENLGLAEKYGKKTGGALLLYGPPGCGKTYIAKATAGECDAAFFNVKLTDAGSEKKIEEIFERARNNIPAIIFFDELDAIAGRRDNTAGKEKKIINQLLVELDGFTENKGVMVMGATNAPWNIDPALRRTGRFSKQIMVPPPDHDARKEIFRIHTRDKPVSAEVDYEILAEATEEYSASDIKTICEKAAEKPWNEAVAGGIERKINMEDFLDAAEEQEPTILPWIKAARKQLKESMEEEFYRKLKDLLEGYGEAREPEIIMPELDELREMDEIKEKMNIAKLRYLQGVINREEFKLITEYYQRKIMELEKPTQQPVMEDGDDGMMLMKDMEWTVDTHPSGRLHYRIRSMMGDVYKMPC